MDDLVNIIHKQIMLERIVCLREEGNEKNTDETKIIFYCFNKNWVQNLILHSFKINPLSYKKIGDFFQLTGQIPFKLPYSHTSTKYLLSRGLISMMDVELNTKTQDFSISSPQEYENPIEDGSMEMFIVNDDINQFVNFITVNGIDIGNKFVWLNGTYFRTLLDFACRCGATNIIKYLLLNHVDATNSAVEYAVQSGSEDAIQFLESQGFLFENMVGVAVQYHHNSLAKWIYENYQNSIFSLTECVESFNTEMLLYFINELNVDINQQHPSGMTILHYAVILNDVPLVRYLLHKGANKDITDHFGKTGFDYAESEEMKTFIMVTLVQMES